MSMLGTFGRAKVLLVQPNGLWARPNDCGAIWHDQKWHADARSVEIIESIEKRTGSLVDGFNALWTLGLNMHRRGFADYLAMLHADLWASSWWISDILSVMRIRNLQACAAHAMIKSRDRNTTSTAIGKVGQPTVNRLFKKSELDRYPETITGDDVCGDGECLLINTGCMVIDLRGDWQEGWIWPQTCSREYDPETDQFASKLVTEDWEWSRLMHERGVRYGATRKVVTRHYGMDYWEIGPRSKSLLKPDPNRPTEKPAFKVLGPSDDGSPAPAPIEWFMDRPKLPPAVLLAEPFYRKRSGGRVINPLSWFTGRLKSS